MKLPTIPGGRAAAPLIVKWLQENLKTRRSRVLLGLLAFAIAGAGLTILDSVETTMRRALAERKGQLEATERLGNGDIWRQRRAETDLLRVQAEGRLWEGETDGLAQANFQAWILDQANRAGITQIDIRANINSNVSNTLKLRQLTAQVTGRFEGNGLFALLQSIAAHNRLLLINRLEVQTVPFPRFEMLLATFLQPPPRG